MRKKFFFSRRHLIEKKSLCARLTIFQVFVLISARRSTKVRVTGSNLGLGCRRYFQKVNRILMPGANSRIGFFFEDFQTKFFVLLVSDQRVGVLKSPG